MSEWNLILLLWRLVLICPEMVGFWKRIAFTPEVPKLTRHRGQNVIYQDNQHARLSLGRRSHHKTATSEIWMELEGDRHQTFSNRGSHSIWVTWSLHTVASKDNRKLGSVHTGGPFQIHICWNTIGLVCWNWIQFVKVGKVIKFKTKKGEENWKTKTLGVGGRLKEMGF